MASDARWERVRDEHRAAVDAYVEAVRALPAGGWTRSWAPGEEKWTPAQITDHLARTCEVFLRELGGGEPMRMKVRGLRLRLLRWLLLPHLLFHRTFPRGAIAPREVRPAGNELDADAALAEFRALAERMERAVDAARARPGAVLPHPYFGAIEVARALRFAAIHVEHHTRQIRRAVEVVPD